MGLDFPGLLLVVGVLLTVAAALSGWLRGAVLSVSVLSVTAGAGLALVGVVEVDPGDQDLFHVVELALLLTLFADGLVVERELLVREWRKPARALAAAMPLTLLLIALAAKVLLPELDWAEALLIGAVLAPTDPVIASSVVTSPQVPALSRHVLNIESGLNDGLALPFVLLFLAISTGSGGPVDEGLGLAGETVLAIAIGAAVAAAAGRVMPRLPAGGPTERYEGVYALGIGLLCFGAAEVVGGAGLIAAFVAGLVLGLTARETPDAFIVVNEGLSVGLQVITFFLFGAMIVTTEYTGSVPALLTLIAITLLIARPVAVFLAFVRSGLPRSQLAFIAWFGPKGVASMLFALLVLRSHAPERTLVFDVAAFVVLASVLVHGLTDTIGARWVKARVKESV